MKSLVFGALLLLAAPTARAQSPAARVSDATSHGGVVVGPGAPTVLIGGLPAARVGDIATCPQAPPGQPPHVGGPIVTGSATVFIGGMPAARLGDTILEAGASATIAIAALTGLIGP
jgi:uncharacterized Zn-binding protein involved in type VI secretion